MKEEIKVTVILRDPHEEQEKFICSKAKRKVVRAGRRGGKTTGVATLAVEEFLRGRRVLYAVPTQEQIDRFWSEVKRALKEYIETGILYKNETRHIIAYPESEQAIRAKTAWNADTLRGDYADLLILDEFQLMGEDTWDKVGAPMLLDNDGDAVFIYTMERTANYARKLYKQAKADTSGRWETFSFSSHKNPFISKDALREITKDMSKISYQLEILAEDLDDVPGALWTTELIEDCRVNQVPEGGLYRIGVGVDPPATTLGECGIVIAGAHWDRKSGDLHGFILDDVSRSGTPSEWASSSVAAYNKWKADFLVGEINNGGDMVENTIRNVEGGRYVNYKAVRASKGKYTRAEPVSAMYENGRAFHVGTYEELEEQMRTFVPTSTHSPDRYDALVWVLSALLIDGVVGQLPKKQPIQKSKFRQGEWQGIKRY
jgi:predicted phage terminase large subunit-like protein